MSLRPAIDGEGWEPDFPEDVSYLLLADLDCVDWGLYEFEPLESNHEWRPPGLLDMQLTSLIRSAVKYPPALALARYAVRRRFGNVAPTQIEFAMAYGESLRHYLGQQSNLPFVLAQSLKDESVDLSEGEWYWVVRIKRSPPIACWVSSDYFIYESPASYFHLSEAQIEQLRGATA